MNELLAKVIDAHGGLDRWKSYHSLTATIVTGGGLWPLKGLIQDPYPREMTVELHSEIASITPFGQPDWKTAFTPDRIAIETLSGDVIREQDNPRTLFANHTMNTPWDPLHRAYFNGYAMWTYLTTPFFMTMTGFEVSEIPSWKEGNETWRGLRVTFPDHIASHSKEQDFYFDADLLVRRHDYINEVAGGIPSAQYIDDYIEVQGFRYPTKRRMYLRGPNMEPVRDLLFVSIDLSNFRFS
ncbi:hypothetical protein ABES02_01380 [Neobacillus pocheonensis]|uniref:hypothetical protein n=1 Tax=Bacillaceae TaxID=186817 RepID=UPI001C458D82|nr:hypothetical protein [Bacillus sp. sid0103]MBV7507907.1 hypothetical protein [Bacillus sp. sid0103]